MRKILKDIEKMIEKYELNISLYTAIDKTGYRLHKRGVEEEEKVKIMRPLLDLLIDEVINELKNKKEEVFEKEDYKKEEEIIEDINFLVDLI